MNDRSSMPRTARTVHPGPSVVQSQLTHSLQSNKGLSLGTSFDKQSTTMADPPPNQLASSAGCEVAKAPKIARPNDIDDKTYGLSSPAHADAGDTNKVDTICRFINLAAELRTPVLEHVLIDDKMVPMCVAKRIRAKPHDASATTTSRAQSGIGRNETTVTEVNIYPEVTYLLSRGQTVSSGKKLRPSSTAKITSSSTSTSLASAAT